nr:RNA-directed DNA polymerase, eukaryota [Tanacetum cinerariifolium]
MGKVKEFISIPNLYTMHNDEGFPDVKLTYLGGLWVMIEFDNVVTKESMQKHMGVKSWFQEILDVSNDFVSDDRIVWVDIEGIPLNVWSRGTFIRIGKKWGETLDLEDNEGQIPPNDEVFEDEPISDDNGVRETMFESNTSPQKQANVDSHLEDPFGFYALLKEKKNDAGHMACPSLSHPPGFTPAVSKNNNKKTTDNGDTDSNEVHATPAGINTNVVNSPGDASVASFSEQVGHQFNNTGGSVLDIMEGFIKVGQARLM